MANKIAVFVTERPGHLNGHQKDNTFSVRKFQGKINGTVQHYCPSREWSGTSVWVLTPGPIDLLSWAQLFKARLS